MPLKTRNAELGTSLFSCLFSRIQWPVKAPQGQDPVLFVYFAPVPSTIVHNNLLKTYIEHLYLYELERDAKVTKSRCFGESQAESVTHSRCCRRGSGIHSKHWLSYSTHLTTYPRNPGMCNEVFMEAGIKIMPCIRAVL